MAALQSTRGRVLAAIGALVVIVALVVGIVALTGDDDDDVTAGSSTSTSPSTTAEPTTSTGPATSTTEPSRADLDLAVFPDLRSGTRYDDPSALVKAFATQVLGFDTDVEIGEYQAGDSRSGEIPIRPATEGGQGPITTVLVRQLSDDSWAVLAAVTDTIRLDSPESLEAIASPLVLAGAATAFEGHVDVALYADGQPTPIAQTFVTGRGDGVMGEFTGELPFDAPAGATHGVLVLSSASGEDGTTWAAIAIRVRF